MVNCINNTISTKAVNKGVTPINTTVSTKETKEQTPAPVEQEQGFKKYIAPAAMIGGGAILMYLGLSGPNYKKMLTQVFNNKLGKMKNMGNEFITKVRQTFEEEYKQFPHYIGEYRTAKKVDLTKPIEEINQSESSKDVLSILDKTLTEIQTAKNKRKYAHLSEPDEMRKDLFEFNHKIYEAASHERFQTERNLLDTSIMPRFKTGKHAEHIEKLEIDLCQNKELIEKEMFDAQNKATDEHLQASAQAIADAITEARKGHLSSAQEIMESAFEKIAKMFNLGPDFKPLHKLPKPSKPLSALSKAQLKPNKLSPQVKSLINYHFLEETLEKTDFSHPKVSVVRELFERMPDSFDVKQLNLVTDRIRLQQAVFQAENGAANPEFAAIIQKLEFLSAKLEAVGKQKLITKVDQSFSKYTPQQLHAKLYYINVEARKLGLRNLEDLDKYLIENSPKYPDSNFKALMPEFQANPLKYFM